MALYNIGQYTHHTAPGGICSFTPAAIKIGYNCKIEFKDEPISIYYSDKTSEIIYPSKYGIYEIMPEYFQNINDTSEKDKFEDDYIELIPQIDEIRIGENEDGYTSEAKGHRKIEFVLDYVQKEN